MKKGTILTLINKPELGFFKYDSLEIRFDKNENAFIFEHSIVPLEELFFGGQLVEQVLVELSEIKAITEVAN
jgi:aromatic ring hydroxylase